MRHGIRFVLLKPRKLNINESNSLDALFMRIQEIHFGNQIVPFEDIIKDDMNSAEKTLPTYGITENNRNYYQKKNIVSATNNFLSQLLIKIGYDVVFNVPSTNKSMIQMQRIFAISGKGIKIPDKISVSEIGIKINKHFKTIFSTNVKKREHPFEFGFEHISDFFTESDNQTSLSQLFTCGYSTHIDQ